MLIRNAYARRHLDQIRANTFGIINYNRVGKG